MDCYSQSWTVIPSLGLSFPVLDCYSQSWTVIPSLGLLFPVLDCHSQSWTVTPSLGLSFPVPHHARCAQNSADDIHRHDPILLQVNWCDHIHDNRHRAENRGPCSKLQLCQPDCADECSDRNRPCDDHTERFALHRTELGCARKEEGAHRTHDDQ